MTAFIYDLQTNRRLANPAKNSLKLFSLFTFFFFFSKNQIPDFWIRMQAKMAE